MCGIAGVFGRSDEKVVARMLDALHHRGPDDGHIVSGPNFTMGTRRLSIIDVGGGRQPLTNEDGSVFAAQNGEIYNFPALRRSPSPINKLFAIFDSSVMEPKCIQ